MTAADEAPIEARSFAAMMAALGPFEGKPQLAAAVSGGADSMALCVLADAWARRRGGRVTALTVDHDLRPESTGEARQVRHWMNHLGIAHQILPWRGAKSDAGIQARAREARYRLLSGWCRDRGVLHLLLAHHRGDQAETYLMRLARGSGPDGLSAMAALVETPAVRILRPLLGVPPGRLRASLRRRHQGWIEDPSNRDPRFARTRFRGLIGQLEEAGFEAARLTSKAQRLGRARQASEEATSALLARCCAVHPAGFAWVDPRALAAAPQEVSRRALGRMIASFGGNTHPPGVEKLHRLHAAVTGGGLHKSRTLGGCRLVAMDDRLLLCRENRNAPEPAAAAAGKTMFWDRRFDIEFAAAGGAQPADARVARLGRDGWNQVIAERPDLKSASLPAPARVSLPALWDGAGVRAVPHLGYRRAPSGARELVFKRLAFRPPSPLSPVGFFLA